jgi:hypothetical protein
VIDTLTFRNRGASIGLRRIMAGLANLQRRMAKVRIALGKARWRAVGALAEARQDCEELRFLVVETWRLLAASRGMQPYDGTYRRPGPEPDGSEGL